MRISAILAPSSAETAMSNSKPGNAGPYKPINPQSFSGWALERATALDHQGARGLLADIAASSSLKRQTAFALLATVAVDEIPVFLDRLDRAHPDLARVIQTRRARDLLTAAFDTDHVPTGYLRALIRIGPDPLAQPGLYKRLFEIFINPAEARKAHVLRYCGPLHATKIAAVDALDPVLLDPEIVSALLGVGSAHQINDLLRFIRTICSTATDEEIVAAFRQQVSGWNRVTERWLTRADRFPAPPFHGVPGLIPLTSAKDMAETGTAMKNCLGTKIGEVLLGFAYYYKGEVEVDPSGSTPVIVEVTPVSDGRWMIVGVHGPRHRSLPPEIVHKVVQPLLDHGALVCAAARPEAEKLASALGIHRWDEFRLPLIPDQSDEEAQDEDEVAEDAFA
jgi:hypothetical protein